MVAINFTVFIDKILSRRKKQTIRKTNRFEPGDRLQIYTGMRTKECRKLGEATCTDVTPITLDGNHIILGPDDDYTILSPPNREEFARADGFEDFAAMRRFFENTYGYPFRGYLIKWTEFVECKT